MKKMKIALLIGAAGLILPSLSACKKNSDNEINQSGRLSIVYYPGGYGTEYLNYFCKNFLAEKNGKNPDDIKEDVDYKLIPDPDITYGADYYITSDSRCPDLIISNVLMSQAVTQGLIANLDDVFDTEIDTSKGRKTIREYAMKEAVEQYSFEVRRGQTAKHSFAMPWTAIPISIAYNNTILQKIPHVSTSYTLEEGAIVDGKWNRAPITIDELKACFEDAEAYDSNLTKFGWAATNGAHWFESLIITWWAQRQGIDEEYLYPGEGSYYDFWAYENPEIFKQTGLQDALGAIQDLLIDNGEYVNSFPTVGSMTIKNAQQAFAEGKALFCLTGDFFEKEYAPFIEKSGQEFKIMRIPAIDNAIKNEDDTTKKLTFLNIANCAYVPAKAANKDLVKEFLIYTTKEENCAKMSEMTGAIRPFDYDVRALTDASSFSSFKKSVFDLYYDADDYLVKFPRNVETEEISPIYLYERVSENIFCGTTYATVISSLKKYTPSQIMIREGSDEFESIYDRAKRAFSDWKRLYDL